MKNPVLIMLLLVSFISCKKGEDDPAISLRSRKNRFSGEWHLTSGTMTFVYKKENMSDYRVTYNFNEDAYTLFNTANGATITGKHKLSLSINKKGEFSFLQLFGSSNVSGNGTWDFLKGVGKYKNKERVGFNAASIGGGSYWVDAFNKSKNYFIYNLVELRNKKMVLGAKEELMEVYDTDSVSCYVTAEYIFAQ